MEPVNLTGIPITVPREVLALHDLQKVPYINHHMSADPRLLSSSLLNNQLFGASEFLECETHAEISLHLFPNQSNLLSKQPAEIKLQIGLVTHIIHETGFKPPFAALEHPRSSCTESVSEAPLLSTFLTCVPASVTKYFESHHMAGSSLCVTSSLNPGSIFFL